MRTLVLGDIHGHSSWKSIVNNEDYDNVVFLGDYLDAFGVIPEDIADNLLSIIKFKEKMGDKLHKASIEIQREKMYGKLQAEVQKERRRATQLNKQVVELRLKLNRLEEGVI